MLRCGAGKEETGWERGGRREGTPATGVAACSNIREMAPGFEDYWGFESILKKTSGFGDRHLPVSFINSFPCEDHLHTLLQM